MHVHNSVLRVFLGPEEKSLLRDDADIAGEGMIYCKVLRRFHAFHTCHPYC